MALGVRRLSVIDVAHGRQPLSNEAGDVWVAYEGELYEYPEIREQLLARGHQLRTALRYRSVGASLRGSRRKSVRQSARPIRRLAVGPHTPHRVPGRDRIGISPLFYAEVDGWLLWASEIKGLLASGMINTAAGRSRPRLFL